MPIGLTANRVFVLFSDIVAIKGLNKKVKMAYFVAFENVCVVIGRNTLKKCPSKTPYDQQPVKLRVDAVLFEPAWCEDDEPTGFQ